MNKKKKNKINFRRSVAVFLFNLIFTRLRACFILSYLCRLITHLLSWEFYRSTCVLPSIYIFRIFVRFRQTCTVYTAGSFLRDLHNNYTYSVTFYARGLERGRHDGGERGGGNAYVPNGFVNAKSTNVKTQ